MTLYATLLAQLYHRPAQPSHQGLARMQALLAALDCPHKQVPSIVVAGTNGKGSTSFLIADALICAGAKVGLFTSPHLLSYRERIRINNTMISAAEVVSGVTRILEVANAHELTPTFFEVTTALALCHFKEAQVDVAVLEVGLGGRLDATNAAHKVLTVLTPISRDHEALLGHDVALIAAEKAAILTPGVPAVVAPQTETVAAVIDARLAALGIEAVYVDDSDAAGSFDTPLGTLLPPFQRQNFACAQAACRIIDTLGPVPCPQDAVVRAQKRFIWPGRYQWLWPKSPEVQPLPCPVILDGGHNPAGAQALKHAIEADVQMQGRRIHVIFAVVAGKDCEAMLEAIAPLATSWRVCGIKSKRRRDAQDLATSIGHNARAFADFDAAWQDLCAQPPPAQDRVLVCGSLFLVADALACLTQAERDPPIDG